MDKKDSKLLEIIGSVPEIDEQLDNSGGGAVFFIIKKHYKYLFINLFFHISVFCLAAFILSFLVTQEATQGKELMIVFLTILPGAFLLGALSGFLFFYMELKDKIAHAIMQQFAAEIGFKYQMRGSMDNINAPYLEVGYDRYILDMIIGEYNGCPLVFFNFNCTIGDGKTARRISFTTCKIQYQTRSHRFFAQSRRQKPNIFNREFFQKYGDEAISLEGNFNKYFTLFIPKGYQIEALEIFTPDIMAGLIDKAKKFSLEFNENNLYIYSKNLIKTKKDLYNMYDIAQFLIKKLAPPLPSENLLQGRALQ